MFHCYPFPEKEECSSLFEMSINNTPVPLHKARVSAFPINRRWPGFQRPQYQTEEAAFASFAMSEPLQITIVPHREFKEAVIRPFNKKIQPEIKDGIIRFTLQETGFYTLELDGMHSALHIFADPEMSFDTDRNSPDLLYFGPGCHDAGIIELKSNQTLFIDEGAIVYGRVCARDANNIRIIGNGILDASKVKEVILHEISEEDRQMQDNGFAMLNAERFDTIRLEFCDHVEIRGITIRDSLIYNIRPCCCRDLNISHVKLIGNWRYNSDGIDMHNCRKVRISNCFIRTFDDSICIKGFDYRMNEEEMLHNGTLHNTFSDVLIEKCVIWCDWGKALEIGAETRAREIFDITFRDCDVIHASTAVCSTTNVDYADIHDIVYENIRAEYSVTQCPILQTEENQAFQDNQESRYMPALIYAEICYIPEYSAGGKKRGKIRNFTYRNIQVAGPCIPPVTLLGYDREHLAENILIEGISLNGTPVKSLDTALRTNDFTGKITLK